MACPHDSPTLLVANDGEKIPVHAKSAYSKEKFISTQPNTTVTSISMSGMSQNK